MKFEEKDFECINSGMSREGLKMNSMIEGIVVPDSYVKAIVTLAANAKLEAWLAASPYIYPRTIGGGMLAWTEARDEFVYTRAKLVQLESCPEGDKGDDSV